MLENLTMMMVQETLDPNDSCTNGNMNFTNRIAVVPSADFITPALCWSSCDLCSPIGNVNLNNQIFSVYPIPVTKKVTIESSESITNFILYDNYF